MSNTKSRSKLTALVTQKRALSRSEISRLNNFTHSLSLCYVDFPVCEQTSYIVV